METRLGRLYGLGVAAGALALALGLAWRPLLWAGVGLLVLVPLVSAGLVALEARAGGDRPLALAILASALGLAAAMLVGLALR